MMAALSFQAARAPCLACRPPAALARHPAGRLWRASSCWASQSGHGSAPWAAANGVVSDRSVNTAQQQNSGGQQLGSCTQFPTQAATFDPCSIKEAALTSLAASGQLRLPPGEAERRLRMLVILLPGMGAVWRQVPHWQQQVHGRSCTHTRRLSCAPHPQPLTHRRPTRLQACSWRALSPWC